MRVSRIKRCISVLNHILIYELYIYVLYILYINIIHIFKYTHVELYNVSMIETVAMVVLSFDTLDPEI